MRLPRPYKYKAGKWAIWWCPRDEVVWRWDRVRVNNHIKEYSSFEEASAYADGMNNAGDQLVPLPAPDMDHEELQKELLEARTNVASLDASLEKVKTSIYELEKKMRGW